MKKIVIITLLLLGSLTKMNAQHNYDSYNRFGITANITQFNILTDNFKSTAKNGFYGGFQTRGSFYNNFDLVLGLNITSNSIGVEVVNPASQVESAEYDLLAAQLNILLSYKLAGENLTFEIGPALMYNEKLKIKEAGQRDYTVNGLTGVTAKDLEDISKINFNMVAGLTGGFEQFRLTVQYHYGVNNILNKLNDKNLTNEKFKGNLSMLMGGIVIYL